MTRISFVIALGLLLAGPARLSAADPDRFAWAEATAASAATAADGQDGLLLAVDCADLPGQGLVYAREWLSGPQVTTLAFPLWVPGTHAPSGPVANLGGLRCHDAQGAVIPWERDPVDPWTIHLHPPSPQTRVVLDLTYIANQPSDNSEGVDIEGGPRSGVVNWNCLLFYPQGRRPASLPTTVGIQLPAGWDHACALADRAGTGAIHWLTPMSLAEVMDRPLLCGASMLHLPLRAASASGAPAGVTLHVVAQERMSGNPLHLADLFALSHLPDEADALFGGSWFSQFDVLLRIGGSGMGLEHGSCSLDGMDQASLDDAHQVWTRELIPHEFVHSWCGKHRRPQGMLTPTFQETPTFDDLWVYEGLTELLGRVLAVRTGLMTPADWRAAELDDLVDLQLTTGRDWRTLRDTCRCSWQLRSGSPNHGELRRSQDYYTEGALFWLVVDRRLRAASHGRRSLDDLCRRFFGPQGEKAPGYSEAELIAALQAINPDDWAGLIHQWIDTTHPLDVGAVLAHSGWTISRVPVSAHDDVALEHVGPADVHAALGASISGGYLYDLDAHGPLAGTGLEAGDYLDAVDGHDLHDDGRALVVGLATATAQKPLQLGLRHRGDWETVPVVPRPLTELALVPVAGESDDFAALLAPHEPTAAAPPAPAPAPAPAAAPSAAAPVPGRPPAGTTP